MPGDGFQGSTAMEGGRLGEDSPVQLAGLRPGSMLAGYRLEAQIGAGGMAVVFRARDERLGRRVALKVLTPALTGDAAFRRRFMAESRAAAAVDDPHIIPVYEAGETGGVLFIAMRFVAGGDLHGVLEREGPLAPARAAAFIAPVAAALDSAHGAGLVHRDVKPANILVDAHQGRPEHVYLSDFGVSKGAVSSVSLTGAGDFVGTPDYSAPEQIQGLAVDGRTDQYALACMAYQLLAGVVPFGRDQGMAVLFAHLSAPPPSLAARRPDLPDAADQVLARALAKTPEKRYGSCRDFADALRQALGLAPAIPAVTGLAPVHLPAQAASMMPGRHRPAVTANRKSGRPAELTAPPTIDRVPPVLPGAARGGDRPTPPQETPVPGHGPGAPARRRRIGRAPRRVSRLGWLAAALALVAGGGFAGYNYLYGPPVNAPASPGTRQPATPATRTPGFDRALGKWQHIGSRAQDPQMLTLAALYPSQVTRAGGLYLRTAASTTRACTLAVYGARLSAALQSGHCTQVPRASYISGDGTIMGTIGVANLISAAAAQKAGQVTGAQEIGSPAAAAAQPAGQVTGGQNIIAPLTSATGPTRKLGTGTGIERAQIKGHYLILFWVQFTTLKALSTSAQLHQLEQFAANLLAGSANIDLSTRMQTGKP